MVEIAHEWSKMQVRKWPKDAQLVQWYTKVQGADIAKRYRNGEAVTAMVDMAHK
jgi:hypothetical protein